MRPYTLELAVPVVQVLSALLISSRISWRRHPALIWYLGSEAVWRVLALYGFIYPLICNGSQIVIRTAVICEILTFARLQLTDRQRGVSVGLALAVSAFAASLTPGLSPLQSLMLSRQYYYLILLATIGTVVIMRLVRPMLECERHTIYRLGVGAWTLVMAVDAGFVRGGWGYQVFPYTRATWAAASFWVLLAQSVVIGVMALCMVAALPKKQPAKVVRAVWVALRDTRQVAVRRAA